MFGDIWMLILVLFFTFFVLVIFSKVVYSLELLKDLNNKD